MPWWGEVVIGLVIAVGLAGTVVPVLPGPALVAAAVAAWAVIEATTTAWAVFAVVLALVAAGGVVKYLVAGGSMARSGVPSRTMVVAAGVGLVGFFVVPVVGLPLGFVAAVYLLERQRLHDADKARASTVAALKAVGLAIIVELAAAGLSAMTWLVAAVAT